MTKRFRSVWIPMLMLLLLTLTGCTLGSSVEELFTLPQLPEEYADLSGKLDMLRQQGYEYIAPDTGSHLESVQMEDLDDDGDLEAVVFLREIGAKNTLSVMVFDSANRQYEQLCNIRCQAERISDVYYQDLTGDNIEELIVGWCHEDGSREVAVYRISRECLVLLQKEYDSYAVQDLIGMGIPGILILQGEDEGKAAASYYGWDTDVMCLMAQSRLSGAMEELEKGDVFAGNMAGGSPGAFVSGIDEAGQVTTDILVCRKQQDGSDKLTVYTVTYPDCGLLPQDLNGYGITEVPAPTAAEKTQDLLVRWAQYDRTGEEMPVQYTYHCQSLGWYLTVSEEQAALLQVTCRDSATGEYCVTSSDGKNEILSLYTITGENRESRLQIGGRSLLLRLPSTIYACELYKAAAEYDITMEALRDSFSLIGDSWDTGGKE